MRYHWHDDGWGPGRWIAICLLMVAFWSVLTVFAVYAVRHFGQRPAPADDTTHSQALRILDERFAHGEIDGDEYTRRRDLLRSS